MLAAHSSGYFWNHALLYKDCCKLQIKYSLFYRTLKYQKILEGVGREPLVFSEEQQSPLEFEIPFLNVLLSF